MIEKVNSNANIQSMLATLRAHQAQASAGFQALENQPVEKPGFGDAVKTLLNQVNNAQANSRQMTEAYDRGEKVPLTDVLAMQKSSLSFEATMQVRNKVLRAYEEIMNMPV